jgi:acyl carrier protein
VAYYTLTSRRDAGNGEGGEEQVRAEVLRAELGRKLPEYMVPVAYVRLEKMPLTPNGKLDRKELPVPEGGQYGVGEYEEPRGEVERTLAVIWAEVLKLDRVGRHDNFFELGGHSLLVMSLMNRIRTTMGIQFSIRTLFEAPTVSDLAERLNSPGTAHIPLRPTMLQSLIQAE